jgi:hypothetical protein
MMRRLSVPSVRISGLFLLAIATAAGSAAAQGADIRVRAAVTQELRGAQLNRSSPIRPQLAEPDWSVAGLLVMGADASAEWTRVKIGGGGRLRVGGGRHAFVARESYARWSAASWLDVEAGRRVLRWGVGYAFTPTGVLDPPRDPTDPTDRLSLAEGVGILKADIYRRSTSLTLAVADRGATPARPDGRVVAARGRWVAGGVEMALVTAVAPARPSAWGGSFTHVPGSRLEWHGEFLSHAAVPPIGRTASHDERRVTSALLGFQYSFSNGVNAVVEYYRAGSAPAPERDMLFVRTSRGLPGSTMSPELMVLINLRDGGVAVVPSLVWRAAARLELSVRAVRLAGSTRSIFGTAPVLGTVTVGATVRF